MLKSILSKIHQQSSRYGFEDTGSALKSRVRIIYEMPPIGSCFDPVYFRTILHATFLGNYYFAVGLDVVTEPYIDIWNQDTGTLVEELLSEEKAFPTSLDEINLLINSRRMNGVDDSIWKLLREFSKGDVGMLKIWTKLYEIWKSEFQALFDRMNIPLSLDCNELRVANQMDETLNNLETQGTIKDSVLDFNEFGLGAVNFVENEGKGKMQLSRVALLRESTSENELVYIVASDKSQHLWRRSVKILSELNVDTDAIKLYQVREMQGISLEAVPYTAINDLKKQMLEISTEDRYEACGKAVGRYLNKTNKSAKVAYANTADMVADIVGISTLICREFTVKRTKIHCFDWDAILNSYSEPGIFLQYTHARLCGIERKANPTLNVDADLQSVVKVPGAIEIATTLDRYPAVVNSMKFAPESGVLLKYLLGLAHLVSSANSKLRIKGMGAAIGEGRWLLLWSARVVLESGMEILGLFPLDEV